MDLFGKLNDWETKLKPILEKYKDRKHPLEYQNLYQLLVMVLLSAQDSDANINSISNLLFKTFPNMESLASTNYQSLIPYISKVKNLSNKAHWLIEIAIKIQKDEKIPLTMEKLTNLKGVGRKSANVIMHQAGIDAEGIIADLHVIRVSPKIGLTVETADGNKIEKQLMNLFPQNIWGEIGMAISFLGREICRPKPKCTECPINSDCEYYRINKYTKN